MVNEGAKILYNENPGSDEIINVWTSDQGFSCEQRFTWPLTTAKQIIKHYFDTGELHPDFEWT